MATFHFDLVSPEKLLFSGDVDQVDVPGSEGDFGVLADHAPFVTTVRPGIVTIFREGGALRVVVNGGFAEVNPQGLTVLADMAVPLEDFDRSMLASQIKDAEEDVVDAEEGWQRGQLSHRLEHPKAPPARLCASVTFWTLLGVSQSDGQCT